MTAKNAELTLRAAGLAALLLVVTSARHGHAEEGSPNSSAAAQALFDEAKRLISQGDAASACPKFEESQRLEPGVGTKLNLANCYERVGRTASAWILFLEVESDTKRNGQVERQTLAHNRAVALQPKLSRLKVDVPPASRTVGLMVQRDGLPVGSAQWGLPIPVDPGIHTVQVSAPGKKAWQAEISVAADASTQSVTVPLLENAPVEAKPAPAAAAQKPHSQSQRTAAYVTFGVSGVGAIVGTVFGLRAISKNNQSNDPSRCAGDECLDSGMRLRNDARSAGTLSTVAFALSGAALATGVVLLLTYRSQENQQFPGNPRATRVSAALSASDGAAQLSLRGRW